MTIGMNNLGTNGRLGNQMFQYAALVGIAKQCGFDFRIPTTQMQHTLIASLVQISSRNIINCSTALRCSIVVTGMD